MKHYYWPAAGNRNNNMTAWGWCHYQWQCKYSVRTEWMTDQLPGAVLLDMLTVAQLSKTYPSFYEIQSLLLGSQHCQWILSWASASFILILSYHMKPKRILVSAICITLAKECMCSASTSFSGSVSMALSSSGQMKLHIPCRYDEPTQTPKKNQIWNLLGCKCEYTVLWMGLKLRKPDILHSLYYVNKCFQGTKW